MNINMNDNLINGGQKENKIVNEQEQNKPVNSTNDPLGDQQNSATKNDEAEKTKNKLAESIKGNKDKLLGENTITPEK